MAGRFTRFYVLSFFTLLAAYGCGGDSSLSKTAKFRGTVTYKGNPLSGGQISFIPEAGSESSQSG